MKRRSEELFGMRRGRWKLRSGRATERESLLTESLMSPRLSYLHSSDCLSGEAAPNEQKLPQCSAAEAGEHERDVGDRGLATGSPHREPEIYWCTHPREGLMATVTTS
jgi:hypothetical protein